MKYEIDNLIVPHETGTYHIMASGSIKNGEPEYILYRRTQAGSLPLKTGTRYECQEVLDETLVYIAEHPVEESDAAKAVRELASSNFKKVMG